VRPTALGCRPEFEVFGGRHKDLLFFRSKAVVLALRLCFDWHPRHAEPHAGPSRTLQTKTPWYWAGRRISGKLTSAIALRPGDEIRIESERDNGEAAAFDYIELRREN
jgi:hypothetical protein